jgi:hypothetical protein
LFIGVDEFSKGLRRTGFTEGKDVVVGYHWLERPLRGGTHDKINDAVRRSVAVIATPGNSPATLAAKAATAIPIVFDVAEDPVAQVW